MSRSWSSTRDKAPGSEVFISMRRTFGITIAAIAAGLSVACSTGPTGTWRDELARAQDRWASHGVTQYVIRIQRSCFCGGPLDVEVRVNGANVSRIDRATGDPIAPQFALAFPTVLGLFQVIAEQIDLPAASLTVSYDPTYGYPLSIVADPIGNAVDDEFGYTISEFRPGN